jgi:hypothetical protein
MECLRFVRTSPFLDLSRASSIGRRSLRDTTRPTIRAIRRNKIIFLEMKMKSERGNVDSHRCRFHHRAMSRTSEQRALDPNENENENAFIPRMNAR